MPVRVFRHCAVALVALLALAAPLAAQNYPERVVRIVNPFPPGGSVDTMARILAQKLSDNLGQQFIVENRAGAGGNTGAEGVAKAEPDGHTLLFTAPGPLVINQTLYSKGLPFDPAKDFAPVALFATAPIVLMVHPSLPANNVQELIALAKKEPGKVNFASAGNGSTNHLSGELFKRMANIDIVHVPYRGAGPAMNDLVGGHVQMFFDLLPSSLQQISGGKVRGLANAGAKRPTALPDLPTIAEQGLPGFDSSSWFGLVAPAKTPPAVLAKLSDEVAKILKK
jgi:tripartite-type tricarboxylate transporter receptor subunit TctC